MISFDVVLGLSFFYFVFLNIKKEQDLDLIYKWFKEPLINKYYARSKSWSKAEIKDKYLPRILGEEDTPSFIISSSKDSELKPIGYIQYYVCNNSDFPEGIKSYNNPLFNKTCVIATHEKKWLEKFKKHQEYKIIDIDIDLLKI